MRSARPIIGIESKERSTETGIAEGGLPSGHNRSIAVDATVIERQRICGTSARRRAREGVADGPERSLGLQDAEIVQHVHQQRVGRRTQLSVNERAQPWLDR